MPTHLLRVTVVVVALLIACGRPAADSTSTAIAPAGDVSPAPTLQPIAATAAPTSQPVAVATVPPTRAESSPIAAPSTSPTAVASVAPTDVPVATTAVAGQSADVSAGAISDQATVATRVFQSGGPSTVNITSIAVVETQGGMTAEPQGTGSGFILDDEGRIVTNNHVVQNADELMVTFANRVSVPATLLGRDPDNDLAVIQVDVNGTDAEGNPIRDLIKPVSLGDSSQVVVGEYVVAIGSPLGLHQTVTAGIVSAIRNPGEGAERGQLDLLGGAVQTDAAINPGNSGGPLFNAIGEVIGVNTAILSQSGGNEGIGFAIPINVVKRVAPELIQNGRYRHPIIGVTTVPLAIFGREARESLGLPTTAQGLLVQEVSVGAAEAGIRAGGEVIDFQGYPIAIGGDVIVAVDGQDVIYGGDLRGYIENNKHPGETVVVTVVRDGERLDIGVTLTERQSDE